MLAALLEAGADPNYADSTGQTVLHVERYTTIMASLVDHGARFDMPDDDGFTALQRVMFDSDPVARGLLRYRRGLDQRDAEGNTLVHLACFSAWPGVAIFETLRELGLDLCAKNHAGLTPIERAATPLRPDWPSSPDNRRKAIVALRSLGAR
jgi:ankyrin repeat protein